MSLINNTLKIVSFLFEFLMILADFLLSGMKRIQEAEMKRIQADPDPQHRFKPLPGSFEIT